MDVYLPAAVKNTEESLSLKRTKQTLNFEEWMPEIVEDSKPKFPFHAPSFLLSTNSLTFQGVHL